jgi:hypothetical protein
MREKARAKAFETPRLEIKIKRFGTVRANLSGLQERMKELMESQKPIS